MGHSKAVSQRKLYDVRRGQSNLIGNRQSYWRRKVTGSTDYLAPLHVILRLFPATSVKLDVEAGAGRGDFAHAATSLRQLGTVRA